MSLLQNVYALVLLSGTVELEICEKEKMKYGNELGKLVILHIKFTDGHNVFSWPPDSQPAQFADR